MLRTFIATGATSGLGLDAAHALLARPDTRLIAGARKPDAARALAALGDRVVIRKLDLEDPSSVVGFSAEAIKIAGGGPLSGIMLNAGLQLVGPLETTATGVERTFAANHLGHFHLTHLLLPRLAPRAPVVVTASGTHDPNDALGRRFGFRGGVFPSAEAVARGGLDPNASETQLGLDRYATSKLCNVLFAFEMARRVPAERARFLAIDPGLMPGTGLARGRPAALRFGWRYVMPALRFIMNGVSSTRRSGAALARLVIAEMHGDRTGYHVDYTLAERPVSALARDKAVAASLYDLSAKLSGVEPLPKLSG